MEQWRILDAEFWIIFMKGRWEKGQTVGKSIENSVLWMQITEEKQRKELWSFNCAHSRQNQIAVGTEESHDPAAYLCTSLSLATLKWALMPPFLPRPRQQQAQVTLSSTSGADCWGIFMVPSSGVPGSYPTQENCKPIGRNLSISKSKLTLAF